jgi:hypothetical protein
LFISLLWLSILAPNSTICTLLFSANSSFKACCCYCFSASHCTLPITKSLQPSQLFIYTLNFDNLFFSYTSALLVSCFSFAFYTIANICISYLLFLFVCIVFSL